LDVVSQQIVMKSKHWQWLSSILCIAQIFWMSWQSVMIPVLYNFHQELFSCLWCWTRHICCLICKACLYAKSELFEWDISNPIEPSLEH
jgi:hypothetical protein